MDVGVDAQNYYPIHIDDVIKKLKKIAVTPHHGEDWAYLMLGEAEKSKRLSTAASHAAVSNRSRIRVFQAPT